jgi:hypothetical protein
MANISQYFINGLILRISQKSLLIQVDENKGNPTHEDRLSDYLIGFSIPHAQFGLLILMLP